MNFKNIFYNTLLIVCSPIFALMVIELMLRGFGYPHGTFASLFPATKGLYPEKASINMTWGPIPYTVKTNSLGFRGNEVQEKKKPDSLRIVTVGDSITDGFFVDNQFTWQYYLETLLNQNLNYKSEVINCARGGGSINKEFYYLKRYGIPLKPDLVILTFVTNDIRDILGQPVSTLLNYSEEKALLTPKLVAGRILLTKTAVGEAFYDTYLRVRSPAFRSRKKQKLANYNNNRYKIEGGQNFDQNAETFLGRHSSSDGLLLGKSFAPEVQKTISAYEIILSEIAAICKKNGSQLLFIYFPAYPQIYKTDSPLLINKTLNTICTKLDITFLDLTEGFRKAGRNKVLHLAPLDYHLNPMGNKIFAELVAEELLSIERSPKYRTIEQ